MANQAHQGNRKRVFHQLDTPFSTVSWPSISVDDQDTILELLCDLLSPLGQHRRAHIKPSKGKRAAKKQQEKTKDEDNKKPSLAPPLPAISDSIDVGLNSIARNLKPQEADASKDSSQRQYSMIIVARGDQSSAFNCHFPQMVAFASKGLPAESKIRLVGISKPCSERLSLCLGVPRVSSVAILRDAPGAGALQDLVQKAVSPVDTAWIYPTSEPGYLAPNINAIQTTIGSKKLKIAQ